MNKDIISVIIPVYNTEKYLSKCLETVTNQTMTNLDILLIDDGSTDNSGKICDEWANKDTRIRVFHKKNEGIAAVRNLGLKEANGKYIAWVDSDDYVELNFLEILYNQLIDNHADMSMCNFYGVLGEELTFDGASRIFNAIYSPEQFMEKVYTSGFFSVLWNKLVKREAYKNVSFPVGRRFEDSATMRCLSNNCDKIVVCDMPLYYYRRHESSITLKKRTPKEAAKFLMENCQWIEEDIQAYCENGNTKLRLKAEKYLCNAIIMQYNELDKTDKKIFKKIYKRYAKNVLKGDERFRVKAKYITAYMNVDFYNWLRKMGKSIIRKN